MVPHTTPALHTPRVRSTVPGKQDQLIPPPRRGDWDAREKAPPSQLGLLLGHAHPTIDGGSRGCLPHRSPRSLRCQGQQSLDKLIKI